MDFTLDAIILRKKILRISKMHFLYSMRNVRIKH